MKLVAGQPYVSKRESDAMRAALCFEMAKIGAYAATLRWWNVRKARAFVVELAKLKGYGGM